MTGGQGRGLRGRVGRRPSTVGAAGQAAERDFGLCC